MEFITKFRVRAVISQWQLSVHRFFSLVLTLLFPFHFELWEKANAKRATMVCAMFCRGKWPDGWMCCLLIWRFFYSTGAISHQSCWENGCWGTRARGNGCDLEIFHPMLWTAGKTNYSNRWCDLWLRAYPKNGGTISSAAHKFRCRQFIKDRHTGRERAREDDIA